MRRALLALLCCGCVSTGRIASDVDADTDTGAPLTDTAPAPPTDSGTDTAETAPPPGLGHVYTITVQSVAVTSGIWDADGSPPDLSVCLGHDADDTECTPPGLDSFTEEPGAGGAWLLDGVPFFVTVYDHDETDRGIVAGWQWWDGPAVLELADAAGGAAVVLDDGTTALTLRVAYP